MKKSAMTVLVCTALLIAPAAIAQEVLVPITITPDVVYGHKMGMALTFDVLRPVNANGAGVMYMVSGGWRRGGGDDRDEDPARCEEERHAPL